MNNTILEDKVILITGGYGYLGAAISLGLKNAGATVVVLGRDEKKFIEKFSSHNDKIFFEYFDLMDLNTIKSTFEIVSQKHGKIDVLINNAISQKTTPGTSIQTDDDWAESLKGTLLSVHTCIRDIIPIFKNQGQGKIINVSSMYGMIAPDFNVYKDLEQFTNVPQYGAAKAAVIQITKYFASLLGKDNITVNCVSPGPFPSNTVQENKEFIKRLSEKTLLKRIGKPEDLQGIFELLCSDKSNFITGQNIAVDGGWTAI